jgi:hypothetical protein
MYELYGGDHWIVIAMPIASPKKGRPFGQKEYSFRRL